MITEAQREARRAGIGGSDAAAICGVSPWMSALEVWEQKVYGTRREPDRAQALRMELGNLLEPVVRTLAAGHIGEPVHDLLDTMEHPTKPWMLGNVDGVLARRTPIVKRSDIAAVVECKTIGWREAHRLYGGFDEGQRVVQPLTEHVFQVAHYLAITEAPRAFIAYLVSGSDFELVEVPRDAELEAMILDAEYEFWHRYVLPRQPPPDAPPETVRQYLQRRYPTHDGDLLPTEDPATIALARRVAAKRAETKLLKAETTEAENKLREAIGSAAGFDFGALGKVTWRAHEVHRLDVEALRADPEAWALAKKHERTDYDRPLRVALKTAQD